MGLILLATFGLGPGALGSAHAQNSADARTPGTGAPDLILVVLDDLRAGAADSGFLGELARRGARFDRARSAAGTTRAAHASLLSGVHAGVHGVLGEPGEGGAAFPAALPMLPELLAEAGYGILGASTAPNGVAELGLRGLEGLGPTGDPALLGAKLAASLGGPRPTFVWLHAAAIRPPDERAARELASSQDAWLRAVLGPVIQEHSGRPRALLITSDHGLHLGENGLGPNTPSLFEAALAIPMILLAPEVEPIRVARTVSGVDVAPTLLGLAGVPVPDHLQGHSLLHDARGGLGHWGFCWSELGTLENQLVCLTWGPDKLVANRITRSEAVLYDLVADPGETTNAKDEEAEMAVFLAGHMGAIESEGAALRARLGL